MSYAAIAYIIPQYEDHPNEWLKAYEPATTTPKLLATDSTGATTLAKAELDINGFPQTVGTVRFIPFIDGAYDLWLFATEADADSNNTGNAVKMADNITSPPVAGSGTTAIQELTVATMTANTNKPYEVGDVVQTAEFSTGNGGGGTYDVVLTSSVTPNTYNIIIGVADPLIAVVLRGVPNLQQIGWDQSGGLDNYNTIKFYMDNDFSVIQYDQIYTLEYICAQWIAGNRFPLAFYGDSTTDGATTVDHVSSVINGDEADFTSTITINDSPNSYPNKTEDWLNLIVLNNRANIYNAGFDSMSLSNNFGNKAFHRVFFGSAGGLNNVDYSDVKAIAISWGTSDSINLDNITTILDSYEWKLELLIVECFERGIQPIINNPVLNFQRTGTLDNGRQNDQSISIIESINKRLVKKYNLEVLSLREPLESFAEFADSQNGDLAEVIAPDGVHPNDKGHTTIASWMASKIHPLVKTLKKDVEYRFTAGNPYPMTLGTVAGTDIWQSVDNTLLISNTSFFYQFDPVANNDFMYRFFVYCEQPMDLTYDCYSNANDQKVDDQKVDDQIAKVDITNLAEVQSRFGRLFADNQGTGFSSFAGSHQLVARLKLGLNQINVAAPEDATFTQQNLGYLRVEPRDESSKVADTVASGFVTFEMLVPHKDIKIVSSAPENSTVWSSEEFKRSEYHYTKNGESTIIHFTINTLHDREIAWNGNKTFLKYDSYNLLKFSGTAIELYRVNPTSDVDFTPVETLIGTATANIDVSTVTAFEDYYITINHALANTDVIIQRLRNSTGATSTLGTINLVTQATQPFAGGYGFGANKSATDGLPLIIKNISVEFAS